MRSTILIGALLLGTGAAQAEARLAVSAAGLSLDSVDGRGALRMRVAEAARDYCAGRGAEITPHESRADPWYCPDQARSWILAEMPAEMRRAYWRAWHEAGGRGRGL